MSEEEMSDSEMWAAHRNQSKWKRADNRERSAQLLTDAGIPFEVKNWGAHLIVADHYDFWPGTGLWIKRGSMIKNRGVHALIARIKS